MNSLEVPTCVSPESWEAFLELRRRKGQRAPLTEYAAKLVIGKLLDAARHGFDAQHMLDEAIENGWTTVHVTARTPKTSTQAADTAAYLQRQRMTPEQFAASRKARDRALGAVRRVK